MIRNYKRDDNRPHFVVQGPGGLIASIWAAVGPQGEWTYRITIGKSSVQNGDVRRAFTVEDVAHLPHLTMKLALFLIDEGLGILPETELNLLAGVITDLGTRQEIRVNGDATGSIKP